MNLDKKAHLNTDYSRFLDFLEGMKYPPKYHIEDWDNMCGVIMEGYDESLCANFYDDGDFRTWIDDKDERVFKYTVEKAVLTAMQDWSAWRFLKLGFQKLFNNFFNTLILWPIEAFNEVIDNILDNFKKK